MVEKGEESGDEGLREAGGGRGEARNEVAHHDGQEAVKARRPRHVNDGVELGEVGVAVQVDDEGERLGGHRLDLHQMLALPLQGDLPVPPAGPAHIYVS